MMMDLSRVIAIVLTSVLGASTWALDNNLLEQINRTAVPNLHVEKLIKILEQYQSECERLHTYDLYIEYKEPAPEIQIDPQSVYRIKIHSNGSEATVFQANPVCGNFGNAWRAIGSIRTFILVEDTVYENWLSGPPQTFRVEGQIILVLPLTQDQCSFLDESVIVDVDEECYGALIWEPTVEDFYGYGAPLLLHHEI